MSGDQIPKEVADELGECFAAYAPGLFGYACALTRGDHALADDLVQAAFMAAARQWSALRCLRDAQRRVPFRPWDSCGDQAAFRGTVGFLWGSRVPDSARLARPGAATSGGR